MDSWTSSAAEKKGSFSHLSKWDAISSKYYQVQKFTAKKWAIIPEKTNFQVKTTLKKWAKLQNPSVFSDLNNLGSNPESINLLSFFPLIIMYVGTLVYQQKETKENVGWEDIGYR